VIYTVKVKNTGTLPAADIEIKALIPPEMRYADGTFPGKANPGPGFVSFDKVTIEAGTERNYIIEVDTLKPGDVRFRVEMRAPGLAEPVFEEESTRIFDPRPAGGGAAPLPSPQ
jgi:hypothetical protein